MQRYQADYAVEIKSVEELVQFVVRENARIALALEGVLPQELDELHAEPTKLREWMVVAADGTNWDPGSGRGVYVYYSAAWHFLG